MKHIVIIFFLFLNNIAFNQTSSNQYTDPIVKGKIILKIKPEFKQLCGLKSIGINSYNNILDFYNCHINKKFPNSNSPEKTSDKYGNKLIDISTIYELSFDTTIDANKLVSLFNNLHETEYCQPVYLPHLLFIPNDPAIGSQYYLTKIKAFQAWDICKGNNIVIIGITDTGVEISHEDLIDNIAYNFNDQIDGIDNDNDGFVDNFRGWDIGNNDNNPEWNVGGTNFNSHGVSISGLAAATTNNGKGVASAGYNVKFLPVKITDSTGILIRAYEGIVYAAEHGCNIINCSWGGFTPNPFGQDIINYATFNKNALIIAAAGNSNNQYPLYPASFENVISVAGTDINDNKWSPQINGTPDGSSYGINVDVCAPGVNIYIIKENNGYYSNGRGTSTSCPIVAGCAGIVKSYFGDSINALQLGEIIRMTCDNIDTITNNIPYAGLLGRGRVNLYRALTDTLPPAIKFKDFVFSNNNNFIMPGDTINLIGNFINYLTATTNMTATITCSNSNIHFIQNNFNIGTLNKLQTISNLSLPFVFYIDNNAGYDEEITFKINYSDINFNDIQYIKLTINPSYTDIDTNNIKLTITSNGKIGYNNNSQSQGNGLRYVNSESYLYEGGIAIAQNETKITSSFKYGINFKINKGINPIILNKVSDEQWESEFNDSLSGNAMLGISIKHEALEWKNSSRNDFVLLKYTLINNNTFDLDSLYMGLYCDWDIINPLRNKIKFNNSLKLMYANYVNQPNVFVGTKLLNNMNFHRYAFDISTTQNDGINIYDGLTNYELFQALTYNRDSAGNNVNGNDISGLLSYGPFNINSGDSIILGFALIATNTIYNLEQYANNAQITWDSLFISVPQNKLIDNITIFPNPAHNYLNFKINNNKINMVDIEIVNLLGKTILKINNFKINKEINTLHFKNFISEGIYIFNIITNNTKYSKKIIIN